MIAVLQRVSSASVDVEGKRIAEIGRGYLILLGVVKGDQQSDAEFLANKISVLRIFPDGEKNMNRSILDVSGEALVVSQFTLAGDWRKGRRPSFVNAAAPEDGEALYEVFCRLLAESLPVQKGQFAAMMDVQLVNDGPVTFVLDSKEK